MFYSPQNIITTHTTAIASCHLLRVTQERPYCPAFRVVQFTTELWIPHVYTNTNEKMPLVFLCCNCAIQSTHISTIITYVRSYFFFIFIYFLLHCLQLLINFKCNYFYCLKTCITFNLIKFITI